jgi:hypothetical protein
MLCRGTFFVREGSFGNGTGVLGEVMYIAEARFDVAFACDLVDRQNLIIRCAVCVGVCEDF